MGKGVTLRSNKQAIFFLQAMDDEKLKIIDEMTNNIMKAVIDKTELSKLFSGRLTRDKTLKVAVNLPHRSGASKENNVNFTHLIVSKLQNKDLLYQGPSIVR